LINIAEDTGGMYFRASSKDKLLEIYNQIEELEKTEIEELKFYAHDEKFELFAFLALFLILFEILSSITILKSIQ